MGKRNVHRMQRRRNEAALRATERNEVAPRATERNEVAPREAYTTTHGLILLPLRHSAAEEPTSGARRQSELEELTTSHGLNEPPMSAELKRAMVQRRAAVGGFSGDEDARLSTCGGCGRRTQRGELRACRTCSSVRYCNDACEARGLSAGHRHTCVALRRLHGIEFKFTRTYPTKTTLWLSGFCAGDSREGIATLLSVHDPLDTLRKHLARIARTDEGCALRVDCALFMCLMLVAAREDPDAPFMLGLGTYATARCAADLYRAGATAAGRPCVFQPRTPETMEHTVGLTAHGAQWLLEREVDGLKVYTGMANDVRAERGVGPRTMPLEDWHAALLAGLRADVDAANCSASLAVGNSPEECIRACSYNILDCHIQEGNLDFQHWELFMAGEGGHGVA